MTGQPDRRDHERTLQGIASPADLVSRAVTPACGVLAIVYAMLAAIQWNAVRLTGEALAPPAAGWWAASTALVATGLWLGVRGRTLGATAAHAVLFALGAIMTANASAYLVLVPEPLQSTNFVLIVLSGALLMLSRRWMLALAGVALAGWGWAAPRGALDADWVHWGALVLLSALLGVTVHEFRLRSTARLIALRALAEERRRAADAALDAAREEGRLRARAEADLVASEKRLAEAQRRESLGVMAGGVAHDFNNLLAAVLGNVELASEQASASVRGPLGEIRNASERAARLCRQMLAYAGRAALERRPMRLADVVGESLELAAATLPKHARMRFEAGKESTVVEGDPTEIGQIVFNLAVNAAEATAGADEPIAVSLAEETLDERALEALSAPEMADPGRFAVVRVRDRGAGMDAETAARMFDPFFTTKDTGRGLGLAASLGIARAHGGAIDVRSVPHEGTELCLYLPVSDAPAEAVSGEPGAAGRAGVPRSVLLVDDEPLVRRTATALLGRAGHRVVEAEGAEQALALPDDVLAGLDVALIDLSMPDGSGIDVAEALLERHPGLHVVLMSGFDREDVLRHPRAKSLAFLAKPFRTAALLEAVGPPSASGR